MRRAWLLNKSPVGAILLAALAMGLATSYLGARPAAATPSLPPALAPSSLPRAAQAPAGAQRTVWDGVFTADQADRGRRLFSLNCAECHGENLEGGEGKALNGDRFWADWGDSTVAELLTYIKTNMPFSDDGSLKGTLPTSTYVDIITLILKTNGFPDGMRELTS